MPKARSQFIDVIDYVDESLEKQLVYKYTRENDEIKQGAKLIVRNGQAAVFVQRGQIADIFEEGNYKLSTGNLPLLSTLAAAPYRFNSPIKSDVYFINTTQFINNKWGTKNPIIKRDPEMGIVRIKALGTFAFRVRDVKAFMNEIFGARRMNMTDDIVQYLKSFVGEAIAQCIGEIEDSVIDFATHYRELSSTLTPYVNTKAEPLGIEVSEAAIEGITLPEEVEKLIDEQSGIGLASKNMDQFVRYQSARAIRDAARQPGGLAGLGAGAAVGKTVAASMNASLGNNSEEVKAERTERGTMAEGTMKAEKSVKSGDIQADQKNFSAQETSEEQNFGEKDKHTAAADTLERYKKLLDQGILTQEEFDTLKSKLLNDL